MSYYHLLVMRTTYLKPKGETVWERGWGLYREFQPHLKEHSAGLICVFINSSSLESLKTLCPFYVL